MNDTVADGVTLVIGKKFCVNSVDDLVGTKESIVAFTVKVSVFTGNPHNFGNGHEGVTTMVKLDGFLKAGEFGMLERTNTNGAHELLAFVKFDNTLRYKVEAAKYGSGNVRLRNEENVDDIVYDGGRKGSPTLQRKDGKLAVDGNIERHGYKMSGNAAMCAPPPPPFRGSVKMAGWSTVERY